MVKGLGSLCPTKPDRSCLIIGNPCSFSDCAEICYATVVSVSVESPYTGLAVSVELPPAFFFWAIHL
jgi:hypothetical protein